MAGMFRDSGESEVKRPEFDNFKEIKPEGHITPNEARSFWDNLFGMENIFQYMGEGKEQKSEASEQKNPRQEVKDETEGLTVEQKKRIKEETGWSDEIIDSFRSMEEYEIYKKAGLQEVTIGEKKALIRSDIDWNQTDEKGRTNTERIKRGLAPLDKNGNPIELHHIGQHSDSPLAELTFQEHRCDGNDTILHDKKKETETHGEGNNWDNERQNYWKDRAEYNEKAENNKGGEDGWQA